MLWVTWRHHRAQSAACLALIAAACLLLLGLGTPMHTAWANGPAGCLPATMAGDCDALLADFQTRFTGSLEQLLGWLNLLPPLIGAFVGAPLLAREFETGTWRLAFTQAVPRTRWLATKIMLLGAVVVALMTVLAAVFSWYRGPLDRLQGRFGPNSYDFEGLSLPAYSLLAFAVGVLAGVLLRRTLAAMAVTIAVFLAVRVPVETWLRPHLQAPLLVTNPAAAPSGITRTDWVLANGLTDTHGTQLTDQAEAHVLRAARSAGGPLDDYLHANGYGHWALVQPADRFWHFQILEATLYTALALSCLTASVLVLRRRPR
jgi:hypothetical protein